MQFNPTRHLAGCCVITIVIILVDSLPGLTQAPRLEQSFPTNDNPKVFISNASTISISSWQKNAVSIAMEAAGSVVNAQEVVIKPENNKLDISCHPAKPDRHITLTLRVPAKAFLEIKNNGNKVEVKEPAGQITILAGKEYIHLNLPESSSLDMEYAPKAVEHRQIGQSGSA